MHTLSPINQLKQDGENQDEDGEPDRYHDDIAESRIMPAISFMTTQMAPDLVEICYDLEARRGARVRGKQSRQMIRWALMGSGIGPGAT